MNKKTLAALKGSILKWEKIVDGSGIDMGCDNCPLCQRFRGELNNAPADDCAGCPVAAAGFPACVGSPYQAWITACVALNLAIEDGSTPKEKMRAAKNKKLAAKAELEFLKSLLPK